MFFGQNREELRRFYITAWRKHCRKEALQPLEAMIAEVIAMHPEYHAMLEAGEQAIEQEFPAEDGRENPFMHMGMHLGLREQIATDRPAGIKTIHSALSLRTGDLHRSEHLMMECLGQALWEAQQSGMPPDEARYLECLNRLRP